MEEKIEFIYDKTTRRPKRLENNVFILYAPERIRLQPGEVKEINMKLKLKFQEMLLELAYFYRHFQITD